MSVAFFPLAQTRPSNSFFLHREGPPSKMNATTFSMNFTMTPPPPQLVSIEEALGIGVGIFIMFVFVGLIAVVGCRWPCVFPSMPRPTATQLPSCADWLLCRCFRVGGLWCYTKCCRRSKNYANKVSQVAHDVLTSFEHDLEGDDGDKSEMVPMRRLLGEQRDTDEDGDWGDWTDLEQRPVKTRID